MGNDLLERIPEYNPLEKFYIERGLNPDCTKDLDAKKRLLNTMYEHMFPPKQPVPYVIMGMPWMPYDFGRKEEGPSLIELEALFLRDYEYNV